jgi:hypothetical protein
MSPPAYCLKSLVISFLVNASGSSPIWSETPKKPWTAAMAAVCPASQVGVGVGVGLSVGVDVGDCVGVVVGETDVDVVGDDVGSVLGPHPASALRPITSAAATLRRIFTADHLLPYPDAVELVRFGHQPENSP